MKYYKIACFSNVKICLYLDNLFIKNIRFDNVKLEQLGTGLVT
jgi:hypothetical protein